MPDFPRDPKDAPFLAAAVAWRADFLISGDKDLL
jgi:putative PIN family toxin of toxin-antitoxin system